MAYQSALTDEALAEMAQRGNEDATEALLARYAVKLRIIAKTFHIAGVEIDDRETECRIAALKAIRTYRADGGAKFETWMKALCARRLISMYRTLCSHSKRPKRGILSLDSEVNADGLPLGDLIEDGTDFVSLVVDQIDAESCVEVSSGTLVDDGAKPVEAWARESLPPERFADVVGLLRETPSQPRLFHFGPSRDTDEGRTMLAELLTCYNDAVWQVLCLVADGHSSEEIATRVDLPAKVVIMMIRSAQRGVARAA